MHADSRTTDSVFLELRTGLIMAFFQPPKLNLLCVVSTLMGGPGGN